MATRTTSPASVVHRKFGADVHVGETKQQRQMNVQEDAKPLGIWEGFAGSVGGSFFREPRWVDARKAPGTTSQQAPDTINFKGYLTGSIVFFSPNFVWLVLALMNYAFFPYDINAHEVFTFKWTAHRFLANSTVTLGYVSFWHVTLYFCHWGRRPFNQTREYRWSKVMHNLFYNICGLMQWTLWEAIFVYCFATGRLPYVTDDESFGTYIGFASFVSTCLFVAVWRDLHFYFAHRLIHLKFYYRYVHSLHHRNTDIEPFAGLSMHPIEHLLYFACAGPALYMRFSPFCLMWFGIHLLISPAASHSGFEDNFQSDQYHYLHHRFFECNYGTGAVPFDKWFGTFRDSLDLQSSSSYAGAHVESSGTKMDATAAALVDEKATLIGMPDLDQLVFNVVTCLTLPVLAFSAAGFGPVSKQSLGILGNPSVIAFLMAGGPAVVGIMMLAVSTARPFARPAFTFLYPFHKEKWLGAFGINVLVSLSVTVVPVYHMVHMFVSEPGQAVFFQLRA
ncbi:unnamed protein product [Prorocentrum cordatum]|uniref:Fatty acid hydroxylase domain-containing protein n=1 Tax=Prorocentrum cordatum TaxID=2364126 RepID=A0ABN9UC86_9DINO|nr:unnamed protein product [Polarella glacialis]